MQIELTDRHADVICKACDVLSRLHMGQMSIVLQEMFWKTEPEARGAVSDAFKAIVPEGHGIFGDVPQDAKIAWDIQQVIRQDLAIRRNGGKRNPMQVQFDDPMQSSKEPLPKIIGQADQDLLEALEALTSNPHIDLGGLVYKVRDSEGEGWDGPQVKHWSDAVQAARTAIAKAEGKA